MPLKRKGIEGDDVSRRIRSRSRSFTTTRPKTFSPFAGIGYPLNLRTGTSAQYAMDMHTFSPASTSISSAPPVPLVAYNLNEECAICKEPQDGGMDSLTLPCGHQYHTVCLNTICSYKLTTCPLCSAPLPAELLKANKTKPVVLTDEFNIRVRIEAARKKGMFVPTSRVESITVPIYSRMRARALELRITSRRMGQKSVMAPTFNELRDCYINLRTDANLRTRMHGLIATIEQELDRMNFSIEILT